MQKILMMVSGLLAAVRFSFVYTVLATVSIGCAFVPWDSVQDFMIVGPAGSDGFLTALTCIVVWLWAGISILFAVVGLGMTLVGEIKLSEYPIFWTSLTVKEERCIEVWKVLVWLLFVPAELASLALLSVYGYIKLLEYPWCLLMKVMMFDLAKVGKLRKMRQ